jgi:hypothetical protein
MKKYAMFGAIMILVGLAVSLGFHSVKVHASSTCTAGPDELCPSDLQLKEVDEYTAIGDKLQKAVKTFQEKTADDRIRQNGLLKDLSDSRPKGFGWDEKKRRWTKAAAPVEVPAQIAPTPVAPAK